MQNFFNNEDDEEKQLIQLTDIIFKTVSKLLRIGSDFSDSVWNTVHKLVKIASEQNKLLLQFPAILAYFVYNFLKNIDLGRIDDINEKLDDIQRLIQRKNLQGLSFNTIKQMLQQELQERKFRRNRPNKAQKQQEGQKQSGNEQGEEGEESENEESQEQQGQELKKESQEGNEQENGEEQEQQEGKESNEGEQQGVEEGEQQSENEGAGEGEGEEQEGENEGNQGEGEEAEQQPSGEGESQEGAEEGEAEGSQSGEEGEEAESQSEEGQSEEEGNEGGQGNAQEGQELGEESESEGSQSGEESGEGQELGEEEGQQSENEGQNGEEQEGQNSGEGENEGGQQSGEESVEAQNGEEGQEGSEQGNEEQSGNEGGQEGEESQSEGEGEGEAGQEGENENEESGEQEAEGESQEGEQGGGGESEGAEQEGGEGEEGESESIQGQNGEQGGEGSEGEGQEIEDIFEDLENNIEEESMILDELEESLQKSLSALSIGKGSGGGMLKEVNPRILELLEKANRILALANQVDLEYANRGVKDQGGVMKGITTGNNIKHMFRSQLILPDEIFLERYTNRALLQRAVENEGVGDFYFLIDKSGSMRSTMPNGYTAFENVSAVALASAMEAEKNNKKVFVQYFDYSSTEPLDVNNVFEIAEVEAGGGTNMMDALKHFMDYYNNYPGLKDVRQIFIMSDFETNYDRFTLEEFKNFAKSNGLIVTCLHVYGGDEAPVDMQYIIDEICDEYYKFNNYDASELFSVVYSKV